MTRLKPSLLIILLISLMTGCTGKSGILKIIGKIDPRVQSIKFWAELIMSTFIEDDTTGKILSEVQAVSRQISQMGVHLDQRLDVIIKTIPARVRADSRVDQSIRIIESEINHIDNLYDGVFAQFIENQDDVGIRNELKDKVLSGNKDVISSINNIFRVIVKDRTLALSDDFLTQVQAQLQLVNDDRCDDTVSPHMWLYDIYINILISEVRAYTMNIIAYSIKSQSSGVSYNYTINGLTEGLSNRLLAYLRTIRPKLTMLPRDIRRCDPKHQERGKTFVEFENLWQPIIVNEDQFSLNHACFHCSMARPIRGSALIRHQGPYIEYPVHRKCNGTVFGCLNFGNAFWKNGEVCLLPENSVKRYGWIKANGRLDDFQYGNVNQCDGEIKTLNYHQYSQSSVGPMPGLSAPKTDFCPYCLCICAEEDRHRAFRAISILKTYTNIAENMVVVGIRIKEHKRMIHIQVKQGKLLPGGRIDPQSVSWKPVIDMDYTINKKYTSDPIKSYVEELVEYEDYVTIDKYGYNFVLEEMMAEKNSIICGVQFQAFDNRSLKGIRLQIATAAFNWTTAKIDTNFKWLSLESSKPFVEASSNQKTIQVMKDLDDPLRSLNNKPGLKNKVIQFSMSSMTKDVGQNVVPFFDSLPVETSPAAPLGGIGLFHKTDTGFGGYISPRVYNLNYVEFMRNFNIK